MKSSNLTFYILLILLLTSIMSFSQSDDTLNKLAEIENDWQLDDNNRLFYTEIIDSLDLSKEQIYNRVHDYIFYTYNKGTDEIEVNDKDAGKIMAKGVFFIGKHKGMVSAYAYHLIRIDIKESRARIILTILGYYGSNFITNAIEKETYHDITAKYPINPKGGFKDNDGKTFYYLHYESLTLLNNIKNAIIEGNSQGVNVDEEW